uniref:Elongator complex protein 4 n=1 Tax=Blastobotrys adeninivorans TaxID=409370 RepID=A0A060T9J5_BLAAD
MSFRKKGVVISGRGSRNAVAGTVPGDPRGVPGASMSAQPDIFNHGGVKPSTMTSHPTISTGCPDLDKLLGHSGLPLGSLLMVEESGTTDFASIITRSFASQGVVHDRSGYGTKLVVVGAGDHWGAELPGVYKDKKSAAKEKIEQEASRVTVGNLAEPRDERTNMKIAWRYARNAPADNQSSIKTENTKPDYSVVFDYTTRLSPPPSKEEAEYIPPGSFASIISRVDAIASQAYAKGQVVRFIIPGLLHPLIYTPDMCHPSVVIPFLHGLRSLCRKYPNTMAALVTVSLELFPRTSAFTRWAELETDGLLHLDPFDEIAEASDDKSKPSQGLVHIYKLPVLSEKGVMVTKRGEYAFRTGRRTFEIREFGIPVEDKDDNKDEKSAIDF